MAVEAEFGAALSGSRAEVAAMGRRLVWMYGEAKARRIRKEMKARGEWKVRWAGPARSEFWADVGRCSDRLRTSADQQTMAPKGASEQVGKAKTSGRTADKVS